MKELKRWNLNGETIVISKEEILNILFHRGRMLFLDEVTISCGKVTGKFTIQVDDCQGHEPVPGVPMFRGVDVTEMALQLLGIIVYKNTDFKESLAGRAFVAREIGGAKFSGPIFVGDQLILETSTDIYIEEISGVCKIISSTMFAKVDGSKKGMIHFVAIAGFDPNLIKGKVKI